MSEKLRIIQFAEQNGNCAAEWEFGVLECLVRLWWKSKENLENMPWLKQANHGKKAAWLELEMNILAWITFCCENFFFWKICLKTRGVLYIGAYYTQVNTVNRHSWRIAHSSVVRWKKWIFEMFYLKGVCLTAKYENANV